VAAHEAELVDAAAQLGDRVVERAARRLRQLASAGEALREQLDDARDQVVARACPTARRRRIGDVVLHRGRLRREDHQVAAALARETASFASRSRAASSTSAARARGTITTPSSSATTTSPGDTSWPAHSIVTFTSPSASFTVPRADTQRDQTGKRMRVSSATSRTPASTTKPRTPRTCSAVAISSPRYPWSDGA